MLLEVLNGYTNTLMEHVPIHLRHHGTHSYTAIDYFPVRMQPQ